MLASGTLTPTSNISLGNHMFLKLKGLILQKRLKGLKLSEASFERAGIVLRGQRAN